MADLQGARDDYAALQRENKYLLRVVGGLWSVVFLLVVAGFSYWIKTVDNKIERLWEHGGIRQERIGSLEYRLTQNDALTRRCEQDLATLKEEVWRIKMRTP